MLVILPEKAFQIENVSRHLKRVCVLSFVSLVMLAACLFSILKKCYSFTTHHSIRYSFNSVTNFEKPSTQSSTNVTATLSGKDISMSKTLPGQPPTLEKGGMTVSGAMTVPLSTKQQSLIITRLEMTQLLSM